jgi:hypothetical protein
MTKIAFLPAGLAGVLALALPVMPAHAQANITYVAGTGTNINNQCFSPAAPCAGIEHALLNTVPGGEIICLSGGHVDATNLIITQSVTIDCGSGVGHTFGGIVIDGAGIVVKIKNLTFNGVSQNFTPGTIFGITAINLAALFVENCHITGYTSSNGPGIGIKFAPRDGVTAKLHVSDSVITNTGMAASGGGIVIQPAGSGSARVVIERTRVEGNTYGIFANGIGSTGVIAVSIKDSVVANNTFNGISAFTAASQSITSITIDRSSSLLNGVDGILAQSPSAFVFIGSSTVMSNATGLHSVSGGSIYSYGNNQLTGNVTDGAATGMLALK